MNPPDKHDNSAGLRQRLAEFGLLVDDGTAASVATWSEAPEGLVFVEGPPGSGKLTLAESYAQAFDLRLCLHAVGMTRARDWQGSDVVVIEDAYRRLSQTDPAASEHVVMPERPRESPADELKRLIAGRGLGPKGPAPLVIITVDSGEEVERLLPLLGLGTTPATTTLAAPNRERQAAIIAHRIPGCPARLINDCLALAGEIEAANVFERPLSLRDILRMAKLFTTNSATSINRDNFDTALDALPKTRGEFSSLSAARGRLVEALNRSHTQSQS